MLLVVVKTFAKALTLTVCFEYRKQINFIKIQCKVFINVLNLLMY